MEQKYIIYQQPDGYAGLIIPNMNCELTLEQIAAKDVPNGSPFLIKTREELPPDFKFFRSWVVQGSDVVEDSNQKLKVQADFIRFERNERLLLEVDPVVTNPLRWSSLSEAKRQAWADYRQALLDISLQSGFPVDVIWPIKPE
jgi:hypothetical protein